MLTDVESCFGAVISFLGTSFAICLSSSLLLIILISGALRTRGAGELLAFGVCSVTFKLLLGGGGGGGVIILIACSAGGGGGGGGVGGRSVALFGRGGRGGCMDWEGGG